MSAPGPKRPSPQEISARQRELLERAADSLHSYCTEINGDMNDGLALEIESFLKDTGTEQAQVVDILAEPKSREERLADLIGFIQERIATETAESFRRVLNQSAPTGLRLNCSTSC